MSKRRVRWMTTLMTAAWLAIVALPGAALAESRTGHMFSRFGSGAFDVVVLRPMSAVALLVGSAYFVASVPLVAPFEGLKPSFSAFVYAPYEYTILRPLGDF